MKNTVISNKFGGEEIEEGGRGRKEGGRVEDRGRVEERKGRERSEFTLFRSHLLSFTHSQHSWQ